MDKIPQVMPYVGEEELENLKQVIKNKWLTEGKFSEEFLELVKQQTGAEYAILVPNGTLGIYISILALGIKLGEVITTDFTFNATASPLNFAYNTPVFVDIDPGNLNIDPKKIEKKITTQTKAIIPVHIYGASCDMDKIMSIAKEYRLKVIEDAAQAYGTKYKGKHVGTIGDVGIISFYADKTVTCGEGGVVLTNDRRIYINLKRLRNQGRMGSGIFYHETLGMNFRMTDLQAAVAVAQLKKLDEIIQMKQMNYRLYMEELKGCKGIKFLKEESYSNLVPFRVPIRVKNKKEVLEHLEKNGIQTREFFVPLHRQPCFADLEDLEHNDKDFPESNKAYEEGICLPVYPGLQPDQIEYICNKIKEVI